ncbi:unannotated protein [freshwater metagenome]|uniref:Unannotated protein n=1 Tax=freshwater metagenome TaxID=449393 RepID=A0A6J7DZF7_9ZZZZ|nr:hypothetical protein [Actinomycetota bacterium]
MDAPAAVLQTRLGLSDDELCRILDADPVAVISGELAHRPELGILLALTDEPAATLTDGVLRRWARTSGPAGRPIDHLLARDFAAFEAAVEQLGRRGFVIGG